jgi:Zn-dependent protease
MTTLIDCPDSRAGEWEFRFFDIPIRVKIWFWAAVVLIGAQSDLGLLIVWVAVCFVSVLWHELGHVLAFRLFGERAEVVLYGWGGMAVPRRGVSGPFPRLVVALAGPFAGFCLAGATVFAARGCGASIRLGFHMFLPVLAVLPRGPVYSHWYVLVNDLLWVNFYWGLINLLPIYPLDGGHAARAIFEQVDRTGGRRKSLILSASLACAVAVFGVFEESFYLVIVFAILAVSSLQLLDGLRGRVQYRPYRP